jgi:hypothetical protein
MDLLLNATTVPRDPGLCRLQPNATEKESDEKPNCFSHCSSPVQNPNQLNSPELQVGFSHI